MNKSRFILISLAAYILDFTLYGKGISLDRMSQDNFSRPSSIAPHYYIPAHIVLVVTTSFVIYWVVRLWMEKPDHLFLSKSDLCQNCKILPASGHISYMQRTGYILGRSEQKIEFDTCESCALKWHNKVLLHNLLFSWWGVISFCIAPFTIIGNVLQYTKYKHQIPENKS